MTKGLEALKEIDRVLPYLATTYEYKTIEKELKRLEQLEIMYSNCVIQSAKQSKAIEILKETPIFAWYVSIYKNAYEMINDVKGFRIINSVEELQEMFDLLKEVLL